MVIKRIDPVSCAKITALLYLVIGFVVGGLVALISAVGGMVTGMPRTTGAFAFFGLGSLIFFPLLYAAIGFVITWIAAAVYNVLAGIVGGIKIEVEAPASTLPVAFAPQPIQSI